MSADSIASLEAKIAKQQQIIEEQKQLLAAEQEKRALAEILYHTGEKLNGSLNYENILDCILEQMRQVIAYDASCIMLVEDNVANVVRWYDYRNFKDKIETRSFNVSDIPDLQMIQQTKKPLLISSVKENRQPIYASDEGWIKSHVSFPLQLRKQVIGFLHLDSGTPDFFGQAEVDRLQQFVKQVTTALKNAQIYTQARQEITRRVKALKKERNFVSAVLDTAGALVMVLDSQGHILRFNRACEQITGYTFEEVKEKHFGKLFLFPGELAWAETVFKTLRTEQLPNQYDSYLQTKDGRQRLISWSNTILVDQDGDIEYVISIGIDITERRQLEEQILAIHQLGRELNLLRDQNAILEIVLETAAFLFQFKSAGYGVLNETEDGLEYCYHPVRGIPQNVNLLVPINTNRRIDMVKEYRERTADSLEETAMSHIFTAKAESCSWLTAPMKIGERIIGMIDVEVMEPLHQTQEYQQLLQILADQTAVAIENARLYREARQRVDELATMNMISQTITSTLNLEQTLTIITNHARRLLGAAAASVVLYDEINDDLWFNVASGGASDIVRGKRLPLGRGIVGWVVQNGEALLVPDVSKDPRFFSALDRETGFTTRSVICVPLQTRKQTIGAVEVINKKYGLFTQEDLRLLSWLATPATTAIENARLFEAERAARERAEVLRDATATLTSTLDLDQVLNTILVYLERVIPCDSAYVFLRQDEGLRVVAGRGNERTQDDHTVNHLYPADNPVYQEIQNTKHPVILEDAQADSRFETWQQAEHVRGWMGIPLMVLDEVIGCLTLDSHQVATYGHVEAALAQVFANQAAVAIQNAQLFEQVRIGREQLQSLSHRLVEVQEMERRHIARELHDEAGQALTSLMVGLGLLEREEDASEAVIARVADLKRMTNDILENLHRLAIDLRPASLDHLGLIVALRQYIQTFSEQHNLATQFESVGLDDDRLSSAIETNLYRVVQEALTNVVRHAEASRVDVVLERRDDHVVVIIEDDGVGFEPGEVTKNGRLGLLGMSERAEMLGGTLVIESAANIGTTIYVEVPYGNSHPDSG